ncbi:MAG: aldolase [Hyphomicrobiaceae bacterium]
MSVVPELGPALHGTAIAMDGRAALFRGPSGAGKSDLALRCIAHAVSPLLPFRVDLVCDDRAIVVVEEGHLVVSAPSHIWGMLEVRGQGIVEVPAVSSARLVLVVDLVGEGALIERLPDPESVEILGYRLPSIHIHPFAASAPLKVLLALQGHLNGKNVTQESWLLDQS